MNISKSRLPDLANKYNWQSCIDPQTGTHIIYIPQVLIQTTHRLHQRKLEVHQYSPLLRFYNVFLKDTQTIQSQLEIARRIAKIAKSTTPSLNVVNLCTDDQEGIGTAITQEVTPTSPQLERIIQLLTNTTQLH